MIKNNPLVECNHIWKAFPTGEGNLSVLEDVHFSLTKGEFFVILGQSGGGKSTLLRVLGGFEPPDRGEVLLDQVPVRQPGRDAVMIFQSFDQLFPWYTLKQNLIYALKKTGAESDRSKAAAEAEIYLNLTGLTEFANAFPYQLSGGMKQRGALARALILQPRLLLMDEPFSSLDFLTKKEAIRNIKHLHDKIGTTILLVTHDIDEAIELGTTIAVLSRERHRFIFQKKNFPQKIQKTELETLFHY